MIPPLFIPPFSPNAVPLKIIEGYLFKKDAPWEDHSTLGYLRRANHSRAGAASYHCLSVATNRKTRNSASRSCLSVAANRKTPDNASRQYDAPPTNERRCLV